MLPKLFGNLGLNCLNAGKIDCHVTKLKLYSVKYFIFLVKIFIYKKESSSIHFLNFANQNQQIYKNEQRNNHFFNVRCRKSNPT